jgi:hypothetical protein
MKGAIWYRNLIGSISSLQQENYTNKYYDTSRKALTVHHHSRVLAKEFSKKDVFS